MSRRNAGAGEQSERVPVSRETVGGLYAEEGETERGAEGRKPETRNPKPETPSGGQDWFVRAPAIPGTRLTPARAWLLDGGRDLTPTPYVCEALERLAAVRPDRAPLSMDVVAVYVETAIWEVIQEMRARAGSDGNRAYAYGLLDGCTVTPYGGGAWVEIVRQPPEAAAAVAEGRAA